MIKAFWFPVLKQILKMIVQKMDQMMHWIVMKGVLSVMMTHCMGTSGHSMFPYFAHVSQPVIKDGFKKAPGTPLSAEQGFRYSTTCQ